MTARGRLSVGGRERGSGTVLALGLIAVVVVLVLVLGLLVGAQGGRWRAQTAADLAALAGAQHLVGTARGAADVAAACAVASETAERNGGALRACAYEGDGVLSITAVRSTPAGEASATARAGPASAR